MHIKPFQAIYPRLDYITSADTFFGTVKEEYPEYAKSGFFTTSAHESVYIHRIIEGGHTYTGLVACVGIEDYQEGSIKKHEHTLAEKEQRQLQLLLLREAVVKPVLLTYPPVKAIDHLIRQITEQQAPFIEVQLEVEDQRHLLWEVSDGHLVQQLQTLFEGSVPETYIADGHHRTSIMAILNKRKPGGKFSKLLCAFFPTSELDILDYNRGIEGLNDLTGTTFMARLSRVVEIEILDTPRKPLAKHEMVMYFQREWFSMTWRPEVLARFAEEETLLDVHLLNQVILQDILGVTDIRTDLRIRYIEGKRGWQGIREKVIKADDRIGFLLYPIQMQDFLHLADLGKVLPPKSTWFEPRMRNGLIVQGI